MIVDHREVQARGHRGVREGRLADVVACEEKVRYLQALKTLKEPGGR